MRFARQMRWLLDTEDQLSRTTGDMVRILSDDDTEALSRLVASDPVAHCYVQSLLDGGRGAGPGRDLHRGLFLGIDDERDPNELRCAVWVGSNIVPVAVNEFYGEILGMAIRCLGRRYGSIFGPRDAVHGIWSSLSYGLQQPRAIRTSQPLMTTRSLSAVPVDPDVRVAQAGDFNTVFPAAVEMFTEELGYSPMKDSPNSYRARVRQLIESGWCLVKTPGRRIGGEVLFKADLGVVTNDCIQIQGVWIPEHLRGRGEASALMSAVVAHSLTLAPVVSLYVNDFNVAALKTYRNVGFEVTGEFATVLF
ncbi:DUF4081 domain-containing GNAT family N-acetyltransferase [Auritidibacter ignavus]|uniref:GNAT family N-acetyltransferase n=1 Tax=Auritidibacter ignavus TaxID=678932 RepID=UPI002448B8B9|nr:DUF4081 domain-containing GNAT family N-acetyltransferase [Auritidibacter ignavus]WGH87046.1 GNAT family N-acetyltransferase [Auritidibacter ignavus]WGH89329.1 GNAT family N-acetyltransferase [Auritidibacter ignavus]